MNRRHAFFLLSLGLTGSPLQAFAARGIIINSGTGGVPPKLAVTDGRGKAPLEPGQVLTLAEKVAARLGDLVDFQAATQPDGSLGAVDVMVLRAGRVLTGAVEGGLSVEQGEPVLASGASIKGRVTVSGGTLLLVSGSSIAGRTYADQGGIVIVLDGRLSGGLDSSGAGGLALSGGTLDGGLSSSGDAVVRVQGTTIKGKLEIINAADCRASGNTVTGSTNTPNCK